MAATTGIVAQLNYAGAANDQARVQLLIDALPNSDSTSSSGATQGIPSFLDEMSPAAAAVLRVELTAMKAAVS